MNQKFFDVVESQQRYQVPMTQDMVVELGRICGLDAGTRVLDLACGKGELLCQWVRHFNIKGTGVDSDADMISLAMHRSDELKVWSELNFQEEDPAMFPQEFHQYDIVMCLRAAMLGADLSQALTLMQTAMKDDISGLLIIGETFWKEPPTDVVCDALEIEPYMLSDIAGISDQLDAAGATLLNMLVITPQQWDAFYAQRWMSVNQWLQDNQFDANAEAVRRTNEAQRRQYLHYERKHIGWGIFIVKMA